MARSLAALLLLLIAPVIASAYLYQEDSVGSAFFLKNDLYPGSRMTLHFTHADAGATVLPGGRADSIPFSSAKIPEILSRLSVPAGSPAAAAIRFTLAECEAPPLAGVVAQRCATSFESMVDFAASSLGTREVRAMKTKLSKEGAIPRQAYMVESVRPLPVAGRDMVACHCMPYPYAVFGCHTTTAAVYTVILAGADGTKAEALTACHADATPGIFWPTYKKLGVAPGSVPVCHFLPQDSMLWMRN
ncbi:BURP domain-containing protein 6-like isoform X2 [Phragmites australis]|uniref:BURP domain-containing protein 6-like isoform X2 n=1 Tax=Phragmites australis TaxID=29695 RepID=UPI002D779600|nr:BURP domain-containing protein 6-like isoform X2 [Phragmites australis]